MEKDFDLNKAHGLSNEEIADLYKSLPSAVKPSSQAKLIEWGKMNGLDSPAAGGLAEFLSKKKDRNTNKKARVLLIRFLLAHDPAFRRRLDYATPTSSSKQVIVPMNAPTSPYKAPNSGRPSEDQSSDEYSSANEDDVIESIFEMDNMDAEDKIEELVDNEDEIIEDLIRRCESIGDDAAHIFDGILRAVAKKNAWTKYGEYLFIDQFKQSLVDDEICAVTDADGVWPLSFLLCECFEEGVDDEFLYEILSTNRFCPNLPDLLENLYMLASQGVSFDRGDILRNVLVDMAGKRKNFFDDWTSETFEHLIEFIDEEQADLLKKVLPSSALEKWDTDAAQIRRVQEDRGLFQKLKDLENLTVELQAKGFEIQDLMAGQQELKSQNKNLAEILRVKEKIENELQQLTRSLASLELHDDKAKNPVYGQQISSVKIASWNVQNLGLNREGVRDFQDKIAKLECDILAVQELRAPPYSGMYGNSTTYEPRPEATKFFDDMHRRGYVSTFPVDSTGNRENNNNKTTSEFMPVFYNPHKLFLVKSSYISNAHSTIAKDDPNGYAYAPTVYEFAVIGTQFHFHLVVVHLCPDTNQIAEAKRAHDLGLLKAWIMAKKSNVVVVGDFNARNNDEAKRLPVYLSSTEAGQYYSANRMHWRTSKEHEYDFILAPQVLRIDNFKVIEVPKNLSDHYIIQGTLRVPGPEATTNNIQNNTNVKRRK